MFDITALPLNMRDKIMPGENGCWEWLGAKQSSGYGSRGNGCGSSMLTHRAAYEIIVGPIPRGLTIDHLCFNKSCVNTDHMEPVTRSENSRRKIAAQTHCKHGHPLSGENVREKVRRNGLTGRVCITCQRGFQTSFRARRRAEVA